MDKMMKKKKQNKKTFVHLKIKYIYLINNPRMFNGVLFDLAEKP